ncbi:zinc ribbon domain-containing protein [Lachnoclostridium sp. An118]|uniref:zinc ribbon domain-containing protein n=1 Tax=Lachnoclostridium sp. An118 TaxID=1965547 RepID=UPI000B365968|nr:zinc ribbon domain-containing protein [Lachnoclostridium sp. An118]OUQ48521.1 transcriptional regulator [Lachnoclostridium sp. An118]
MDTKTVIYELRTKHGLSQDELAQKVFVTRQAVSRWENGETVPNTETLKLLSNVFEVSINTLLGSPRKLFCQCCGMPLEDSIISKESNGELNEEYCKWCYSGGQFAYPSKEALLDYLVEHMPNPDNSQNEERRTQFDLYLSQLKHWKK